MNEVPRKSNTQRHRVEQWLLGAGGGAAQLLSHGHRVPIQDHEKVLEMDGGDDGINSASVINVTELNAEEQLRW